ncbi:hypothetical protein QBC33DRAFT_215282 [Phialemonium atrogriseum]|uniref:Uncharacterized protein n=1 Tax=Phialemonium atrogriseum TaxID=1093897 RepID=A0AAJ0C8S3_9PEZI|nr:uncharacterized protein QBC33DRAFT_215282 [Phialemonium atrogriseum]KAK1770749.1 hypothetical protein QBC33DRAFT_215282 [Phialemonium atrogriseum]
MVVHPGGVEDQRGIFRPLLTNDLYVCFPPLGPSTHLSKDIESPDQKREECLSASASTRARFFLPVILPPAGRPKRIQNQLLSSSGPGRCCYVCMYVHNMGHGWKPGSAMQLRQKAPITHSSGSYYELHGRTSATPDHMGGSRAGSSGYIGTAILDICMTLGVASCPGRALKPDSLDSRLLASPRPPPPPTSSTAHVRLLRLPSRIYSALARCGSLFAGYRDDQGQADSSMQDLGPICSQP